MRIQLILALILAGLLVGCQMPQPRGGMPMPPMPSSPSSSPSSPSAPSPPSSPSSPSSSSPSGSPPPSEPSGSEDSGDTSAGDTPPSGEGSEQLPMPVGEGSDTAEDGASVEGLDEQLDAALEDFDEAVTGEGSGSTEDTIDILNPMGGGSSGMESDEPLYEEGNPEDGGGPIEDDEFAKRAEEGGGESAQTSGQQVGGSSNEGGEAGTEPIVPIPEDIGDGRSDDIVLRQVRDAAMKERDATLREKLWDEYRRIRDQR